MHVVWHGMIVVLLCVYVVKVLCYGTPHEPIYNLIGMYVLL